MKSDDPAFEKSVDELHSSVRLANVLQTAADKMPPWAKNRKLPPPLTLGALVQWSERDMSGLPHMGKRTLSELVKLLEQEGMRLRDEDAFPAGIHVARPLATTPTTMTDPDGPCVPPQSEDLEIVKEVVGLLRRLDPPSQMRSLKAICILLGVDIRLNTFDRSDIFSPDSEEPR